MDFIVRMLVEKYAGRHNPNLHVRDPQTAIDVTDLANIIMEQDREIARLNTVLALHDNDRNAIQDDGSSKFIG